MYRPFVGTSATALLWLGCSATPAEPPALILVATTPTALSWTAGTPVSPAPTVRVRDQSGDPVMGLSVGFAVTNGGGTVRNTSVLTDAEGTASVGEWILGAEAGLQTVTAQAPGMPAVVFQVSAYLGYGSVTGVISVDGTGYPVPGGVLWPALEIVATAPGYSEIKTYADRETGTFTLDNLVAVRWTLLFRGLHPWYGVFPEESLYGDTSLAVTVLPSQTVVVPETVLQPVAPFILIATEVCPWSFSTPPTSEDWDNCEGGYWGHINVAVEVEGVAGTATAGQHFAVPITQDQWYVAFRDIPLGEYDVSAVPVRGEPGEWFCTAGTVRLVPWRSSPVRIRVADGLAYLEFEYWCEE